MIPCTRPVYSASPASCGSNTTTRAQVRLRHGLPRRHARARAAAQVRRTRPLRRPGPALGSAVQTPFRAGKHEALHRIVLIFFSQQMAVIII